MTDRTMLDHDFGFARRDRFPRRFLYSYVTDDDQVVFHGDLPTGASVGHRLHLLGTSGRIASFGGERTTYRGRSWQATSAIAGNSRAAWVVEPRPNRLTRWDLTPEPVVGAVIVRGVEEFDRHDASLFPRARNHGIMVDESGVWVLWEAPDPAWRARTRAGEDSPDVPRRMLVESYLDLLSPATGHTLARARFDGAMAGFAAGSRCLVAYSETDEGVTHFHLLQPRVTGLSEGRPAPQASRC